MTYLDSHDIDLLSLLVFPSDAQIKVFASEVAEEAKSLISLLGIMLESLYHPFHNDSLPLIIAWHQDDELEVGNGEAQAESETITVTKLIQQYKEPSMFLHLEDAGQRKLDNLTNAAIAVSVEEQLSMYVNTFLSRSMIIIANHHLVLTSVTLFLNTPKKSLKSPSPRTSRLSRMLTYLLTSNSTHFQLLTVWTV